MMNDGEEIDVVIHEGICNVFFRNVHGSMTYCEPTGRWYLTSSNDDFTIYLEVTYVKYTYHGGWVKDKWWKPRRYDERLKSEQVRKTKFICEHQLEMHYVPRVVYKTYPIQYCNSKEGTING